MADVFRQFGRRGQRGRHEACAPLRETPRQRGNTIVCLRGSFHGRTLETVAAIEAVLCELVRGRYDASAAEVGSYFAKRLATLPHVVEVRGAGLMVGCDLDAAAGDAHDIVAAGLDAGLVFNATGDSTLRFLPPLVCTRADVDEFVAGLGSILEAR